MKRILGYIYYLFGKYIVKNENKANMGRWFYENGDEKYLLSYSLNEDSVVFEVGGYCGQFTQKLLSRFNPKVFVFEPVKKFFAVLTDKFSNCPNVKLFNMGLSDHTSDIQMLIKGDESSSFDVDRASEPVSFVDVVEFFDNESVEEVDLMNVNIEGGEYNLLPRLVDSGIIEKIKFLQVQFHDVIGNSRSARERIVEDITKTHDCTFSFPFVWEGFRRKSD